MHISDLVGQYNNHGNVTPESVTGVKGVEKLVATVREMTVGNIFEGTVSQMRGGRVTLALSNGQELSACLDAKISLAVGQSMFFQVKSNDGSTVAIRPFLVDGTSGNLTLMKALESAGMPVDARNLSMVNTMMQEQMPIDMNHVSQMGRLASLNPEIPVTTVVQLQKLQIPVTVENASMFENYKEDAAAITKEMQQLFEELPKAMGEEELPLETMRNMNAQILQIMADELPEPQMVMVENGIDEEGNPIQTVQNTQSLEYLLSEEDLQNLSEQLKAVPGMEQDATLFPEGELSGKATIQQLMDVLSYHLVEMELETDSSSEMLEAVAREPMGEEPQTQESIAPQVKHSLSRLFSGKEFQEVIKAAANEKWLLKPEQLKEENSVKSLYERLERQMRDLEQVAKASGTNAQQLGETVKDIRSNINFMDQINQTYTYLQLPLKMAKQQANADLYVYTNKKSLEQDNKNLTAFLHLDMEHLGSTDVSVKMEHKKVSTRFYLEDDSAYQLLEAYMPKLEARLQALGYDAKVTIINEDKKVNFVEDFLKKDQPSAGALRRYSFDMRA